jgi:mercuric ion transport protein
MRWIGRRKGSCMARLERSADAAGAAGAIIAALCCAGVPAVIGAFTAVGLGFLITDLVLLPVLVAMLALALWGLARSRARHGSTGPLVLGSAGAVILTIGVFTSRWLLGLGAVLLLGATLWNVMARRRREGEVLSHAGE